MASKAILNRDGPTGKKLFAELLFPQSTRAIVKICKAELIDRFGGRVPLKQGRGKQLVRGWSQVIEGDGRGKGGG